MYNNQRSENYEKLILEFGQMQLQNENLLNNFPYKLSEEFVKMY